MRRVVVGLVVSALLLVACGASGGGSAARGAPVDGGELLEFTLPAVSGGQIHGADYRDRALALWFWAPW
jgi:hypothetical protein